jgi:hypothetical protein
MQSVIRKSIYCRCQLGEQESKQNCYIPRIKEVKKEDKWIMPYLFQGKALCRVIIEVVLLEVGFELV